MKTTINQTLGGDEVHAYTFGRLDAALGEHPMRFVNGPADLRKKYMAGFNSTLAKLETQCTIKPEFKTEFPWHKSNGTTQTLSANESAPADF